MSDLEATRVRLLKVAVSYAVEQLEEGRYPVEVESAWVCVQSQSPLQAKLLVCLKGATAKSKGNVQETAAMKAYTAAFVDDDDETSDDLLDLEAKHKTPAAAVKEFKNEHAETWAAKMKGVKWADLKSSMFHIGRREAHEMLNIAERSLSRGKSPLDIPRYSFYAPGHPDLLDSLGLECDDEKTKNLFTASFQQVWPGSSDDTDAAVDRAIETTLAPGGKGSKKKPRDDTKSQAAKKKTKTTTTRTRRGK